MRGLAPEEFEHIVRIGLGKQQHAGKQETAPLRAAQFALLDEIRDFTQVVAHSLSHRLLKLVERYLRHVKISFARSVRHPRLVLILLQRESRLSLPPRMSGAYNPAG